MADAPGDDLPEGLAEGSLPEGLAEAFDHLGRLRFDQYMELALYAPASGFFATVGGAGRRGGDFITSPEVGPLFGAVLARHLDDLWERLGRPDPFTVVEGGAGRGALAIAVRAASPVCAGALHWVMVERSAALRRVHGDHLDLAPLTGGDRDGPTFSSVASMPPGPFTGAVIANELLDNLPFRLLEHAGGTWHEVMVTRDGRGESLGEVLVEVAPVDHERVEALVATPPDGSRIPWQQAAAGWVRDASEVLARGEVLVFDYTSDTATLAGRPQQEWLRTYRAHQRGADPLEAPGRQDITVEVARDQLPGGHEAMCQGDWLRANGISALVERSRARWHERAGIGDLEAIRARSAPVEAEALTDPAGLGAFTVLTWEVGGAGHRGVSESPDA